MSAAAQLARAAPARRAAGRAAAGAPGLPPAEARLRSVLAGQPAPAPRVRELTGGAAALSPRTFPHERHLRGPHDDAVSATFYAELRGIAQRVFAAERAGHTLQPTAVVHEACLRLMASGLPELPRNERLALAGRVLRQVLVDHARARGALKRGGDAQPVVLDLERDLLGDAPTQVDFDAIHRALERLRALSPRQAEVVELRIFSGLTMEQTATVLGVSKRTAEGDWTVARAWLRRELGSALGLGGKGVP